MCFLGPYNPYLLLKYRCHINVGASATCDENAMEKALDGVTNQRMGWLKAWKNFKVPFTSLRRMALDRTKRIEKCPKRLGRFLKTFSMEQERLLVD